MIGAAIGLDLAVAAQTQQAAALPHAAQVDWTYSEHPRPVRYRWGDVTVTVRGETDRETDLIQPLLRIEAAGRAPVTLRGSLASPIMPNRIGVGLLDRTGTIFVYYQSYTGGAHCCNAIQVAVVGQDRIRTVELGAWDGEPHEDFPRDVDGDGTADFVQTDDRFRYAFASGAGSRTPPLILNVIDGAVVDVSMRPAFRPLYEASMAENRSECLDPDAFDRNGACAAFVASAARLGRFDVAWAEMVPAHEPAGSEGVAGPCTDAGAPRFATVPEAMRHCLRVWGYLPG